MSIKTVVYYDGQDIETMSREQLISALRETAKSAEAVLDQVKALRKRNIEFLASFAKR